MYHKDYRTMPPTWMELIVRLDRLDGKVDGHFISSPLGVNSISGICAAQEGLLGTFNHSVVRMGQDHFVTLDCDVAKRSMTQLVNIAERTGVAPMIFTREMGQSLEAMLIPDHVFVCTVATFLLDRIQRGRQQATSLRMLWKESIVPLGFKPYEKFVRDRGKLCRDPICRTAFSRFELPSEKVALDKLVQFGGEAVYFKP